MAEERIGLHNLSPAKGSRTAAQARRPRRGLGHGQDLRPRPQGRRRPLGRQAPGGFEGGQNPLQMRMRKLRGPTMKKSMPFEQYGRTQHPARQPLRPRGALRQGRRGHPRRAAAAGLATRRDVPVKVLGNGELTKELTVHAHGFSATAREKIEAAGGSAQVVEG